MRPFRSSSSIRRCLEKDPTKRPQSALEVVQGLDQALVSSGQPALGAATAVPAGTEDEPATSWRSRSRPCSSSPRPRGCSSRAAPAAAPHPRATRRAPSRSCRSRTSVAATATATSAKASPTSSRARSARCRGCASRRARRCSRSRGKGMDAQQIAKTLKVSSLLEGTIRRSGERLRVTAQLTNASDGLALWSDTYERQMKDVFQVQDDIAGSIAGALRVALAPASDGKKGLPSADCARRHRGPRRVRPLPARPLLLASARQRSAAPCRGVLRPGDRPRSDIRARIRRSRRRARACSRSTAPRLPTAPIPLARKAAEQALSLDSTLAEAHTTLGLILKSTGEWEPAADEFRRGIALDSTYATGHQWYAEVLIITGRVRRGGRRSSERARDLEPLSPVINAELGYALGLGRSLSGRNAGGSARGRAGLDAVDGPRVPRVHASCLRASMRRPSPAFGAPLGSARGSTRSSARSRSRSRRRGKVDSARAVLAPAEARAKGRGGSPVAMAMGYAGLGDRDAALRLARPRGAGEGSVAVRDVDQRRDLRRDSRLTRGSPRRRRR